MGEDAALDTDHQPFHNLKIIYLIARKIQQLERSIALQPKSNPKQANLRHRTINQSQLLKTPRFLNKILQPDNLIVQGNLVQGQLFEILVVCCYQVVFE